MSAPAGMLGAMTRRRRRRSPWPLILLVILGLAIGLGLPRWQQHQASANYPVTEADLSQGRAQLAALTVAETTPPVDYDRDEFGQRWADEDHNGCDTRNDILARDLTAVTYKPGTHDCVVLSGVLDEPYGGGTIHFERGPASADVQIDHVVALANAWASGAWQWDDGTRQAFANDPANLLAVDGDLNQQKSAQDASTWQPPNRGYRCAYALQQVRVKSGYGLSVTPAEARALGNALDTCRVSTVPAPEPSAAG